jgi:beta-glucosidase
MRAVCGWLAAVLLAVLAVLLTTADAASAQAGQPWRNANLSPDRRAELLVDAMTLDQKVTLFTPDPGAPIPELGIPPRRESDGCCGVNTTATPTTALPVGLSLASTFDEGLGFDWGRATGAEAWLTGQSGITAPSLDLNRTPFNGRMWETFGEDPLVMGRLGTAAVRGVQDNPVYSLAKHYVLNDQETRRGHVDARVDERTLNEIWIRPWEIVVRDAEPGAVMCAFPKVNGERACDNRHLLTDILKGRLGFPGFVSSDFNACSGLESFAAGTDVCGPAGGPFSGPELRAAVEDGRIAMERFNDMVRRVLRTFFATGVFDNPPPGSFDGSQPPPIPDSMLDQHERVARQVAREGSVLLKNDPNGLPLRSEGLGSVAVIGSDADRYIAGGGASAVPSPARLTTIVDGIAERAGDGVEVTHVPGTDPVRLGDTTPGLEPVPSHVLTPPGGGPSDRGLLGEYFTNPMFAGTPELTRVEDQVNWRHGLSGDLLSTSQAPGLAFAWLFNPAQSRRWTGTLTAPVTGDYTIGLSLLGSATLFVDGEAVVEADADSFETVTATVPLVAGQSYGIRIDYRPDAPITFDGSLNDAPFPMIRFDWTPPSSEAVPGVQAAVEAAENADVAVVVARDYTGEAMDRGTLKLGQGQDRLIREVAAASDRTIVVLATSGPVLMPWLDDVEAVLEAWYPGEAQGEAVADLLFGDFSPSGKLPLTWPASDDQPERIGIENPFEQHDEVNPVTPHDEGVFLGYRGYEQHGVTPLFAFGHGLTYTTFEYSALRIADPRLSGPGDEGLDARVQVLVRNAGRQTATETVQVYSGRLPTAAVDTPPKQLIGWGRVTLEPGEEREVTVPIDVEGPAHPLAYWDAGSDRWVTPLGEVPVHVGSSSSDIRLTGTMTVRGPRSNSPPECENVTATTAVGRTVTTRLRCIDADGDALRLSIVAGPARGTLGAVDQDRGTVSYTPAAGFRGTDTFAFRASDGAADSAPATATITVTRRGGACANRITGTRRGDRLVGTAGGDRIRGRGGPDRIFGRRGDDCLAGERGRDRLSGGAGEDRLDGGSARDVARAGAGDDRVEGGRASDRLSGGRGDDRIRGGRGGDGLSGGRGDDRIRGGRGDDRIAAAGGRDGVLAGTGDDRIRAKDGRRDSVDCGRGFDTVAADRGDRLKGCERRRGRRAG